MNTEIIIICFLGLLNAFLIGFCVNLHEELQELRQFKKDYLNNEFLKKEN